ncbi:MAG: hypothetical protein WAN36_14195 [Calditrichia bacterium]
MLIEVFADLTRLEGIDGIVFFDQQNKVVENWTAPDRSQRTFDELGIHYLQLFEIADTQLKLGSEIVIEFDKGKLYSRKFEKFIIVVLARKKVEPALIRFIINVAVAEKSLSRKVQRGIKKLPDPADSWLKSDYFDDAELKLLQKMADSKKRKMDK